MANIPQSEKTMELKTGLIFLQKSKPILAYFEINPEMPHEIKCI